MKRQKQDEGPISTDARGFVLVCVFLGFLAFREWLALWLCPAPSTKHEVNSIGIIVRYHTLPGLELVPNNKTSRLSAPAETRGCYQLAGRAVKVDYCSSHVK